VIVLDAYAVIAALLDEPAAPEVAALLRNDEGAMLTALGVAEVLDRLVRIAGIDADELALDLAELGLADPEPLDPAVAVRAGLLRSRRYHRTRCAVSLADCVVVEVAREHHAAVATSDKHLLDVCHAEGIPVVALPDTAGERWKPS
jgi:PIN domain nuclease of toxin-antitoxin system